LKEKNEEEEDDDDEEVEVDEEEEGEEAEVDTDDDPAELRLLPPALSGQRRNCRRRYELCSHGGPRTGRGAHPRGRDGDE